MAFPTKEAVIGAVMQLSGSVLTILSHRLTKHLMSRQTNNNVVFSPVCIYSALSQMAFGARGRTLSELLDVLTVECREELDVVAIGTVQYALSGCPQLGGVHLPHALGIFHHATRTLNQPYCNTAAAWGGVPLAVDDWTSAKEQINSWFKARTGSILVDSSSSSSSSLLRSLLVEEEDSTRLLLLANAIHFQGSLERSFLLDGSSRDMLFHRLDGSSVSAQFVSSNEPDQYIVAIEGLTFKLLKMMFANRDPFHGMPAKTMAALLLSSGHLSLPQYPRYSLYIVLPDARDGLWSLHDKIMAEGPDFLYRYQPKYIEEVGDFWVPKFKVSSAISLKHVLLKEQVSAVFSKTQADLPHIMMQKDEQPAPFLADILHKAVIEVQEEDGFKAATKPRLQQSSGVDFVADHPFAFFVVEEVSGTILLTGHVLDPTQSSP